MKLYVCYGTWKPAPRPGGHPCGTAYHALKDAGHDPEVVKSYGLGILPDGAQPDRAGRKRAKELTGSDDGAGARARRRHGDRRLARDRRLGQGQPGAA